LKEHTSKAVRKKPKTSLKCFCASWQQNSARLQNMDKAILSIFKLFNEVNDHFNKTNRRKADGLLQSCEEISQKIAEG
jgi:hypothetical protein